MTLITPGDELRSAAELLRRHTVGVTPGPWKSEATRQYGHRVGTSDNATWVAWTGEHREDHSARDADWIALMDPGVGLELANLLEAVSYDPDDGALDDPGSDRHDACDRKICAPAAALALARAINGGGRQ